MARYSLLLVLIFALIAIAICEIAPDPAITPDAEALTDGDVEDANEHAEILGNYEADLARLEAGQALAFEITYLWTKGNISYCHFLEQMEGLEDEGYIPLMTDFPFKQQNLNVRCLKLLTDTDEECFNGCQTLAQSLQSKNCWQQFPDTHKDSDKLSECLCQNMQWKFVYRCLSTKCRSLVALHKFEDNRSRCIQFDFRTTRLSRLSLETQRHLSPISDSELKNMNWTERQHRRASRKAFRKSRCRDPATYLVRFPMLLRRILAPIWQEDLQWSDYLNMLDRRSVSRRSEPSSSSFRDPFVAVLTPSRPQRIPSMLKLAITYATLMVSYTIHLFLVNARTPMHLLEIFQILITTFLLPAFPFAQLLWAGIQLLCSPRKSIIRGREIALAKLLSYRIPIRMPRSPTGSYRVHDFKAQWLFSTPLPYTNIEWILPFAALLTIGLILSVWTLVAFAYRCSMNAAIGVDYRIALVASCTVFTILRSLVALGLNREWRFQGNMLTEILGSSVAHTPAFDESVVKELILAIIIQQAYSYISGKVMWSSFLNRIHSILGATFYAMVAIFMLAKDSKSDWSGRKITVLVLIAVLVTALQVTTEVEELGDLVFGFEYEWNVNWGVSSIRRWHYL